MLLAVQELLSCLLARQKTLVRQVLLDLEGAFGGGIALYPI